MNGGGLVHVIMSVHRPRPDFLRQQAASVFSQSWRNVKLHVCPDGPHDGLAAMLGDMQGKAVIHPSAARRGIYGNFMRGLAAALHSEPRQNAAFAFCDQDDVWLPGKIAAQMEALAAGAAIAYCDAAIIDEGGAICAPSLFTAERRIAHADLASLLIGNDVSGNGLLVSRRAAELACAFAPSSSLCGQKAVLHDWWTALAARLTGSAAFINRPLLQYRRHGGNAIGPAPQRMRRRLWGSGAFSAAFRAKSAGHFAIRHHLAQRLSLAAQAAGAPLARGGLLALYAGQPLKTAAFLLASIAHGLQGDRARAQSLYMSYLGKLELQRRAARLKACNLDEAFQQSCAQMTEMMLGAPGGLTESAAARGS